MKTITRAEFMTWAEGVRISLDPRYPDSSLLAFTDVPGESYFWRIPESSHRRPYLLGSILELLGDWSRCYAWRHAGWWPDDANVLPDERDMIEHEIHKGLGMPLGTSDLVEFEVSDRAMLLTLLYATVQFAWSAGEDLYLVPDSADVLIRVSHHDRIEATFRERAVFERWADELTARDFAPPEAFERGKRQQQEDR